MQFEQFCKVSKGEKACFLNLDAAEECIKITSKDPMAKHRKMKVPSEVFKGKFLRYENNRQFCSAAMLTILALLQKFGLGTTRRAKSHEFNKTLPHVFEHNIFSRWFEET